MDNQAPAQSRIVLWWIVFLLLAIIAVAAWLVWRGSKPAVIDNLAAVGQLGQSSDSDFEPALQVDDQVPGDVVYMTSVLVDSGSWVAIHRDRNGALGEVLGAGYFDDRVSTGAVDLSASTLAGGTYHAVLYHDVGNDQRFNRASEVPWLNQAGQTVISTFQVMGVENLGQDKG